MPLPIECLPTQKSVIDLAELPKNSFNSVLYGYKLTKLLDDVILIEFTDETPDGTLIMRKGLFVPINLDTKAWRIGKVLLVGPAAKYTKVGDEIMFPNNLGIPISNIEVDGYGSLKKGLFINEARIFGYVTNLDDNESVSSIVKDSSAK